MLKIFPVHLKSLGADEGAPNRFPISSSLDRALLRSTYDPSKTYVHLASFVQQSIFGERLRSFIKWTCTYIVD